MAHNYPGGTSSGLPLQLDVNERTRLMRDGVLNNSSLIISGLISVVLVPIMLRGLGTEPYGLWIAALSVTGVAALFDFGLGVSVTREVAVALSHEARNEAAKFVRAAGTAYLMVGVTGALLIAALGIPISGAMRFSPSTGNIATVVFALAGVAFLADRWFAFTLAVLRGLRRFDAANVLSSLAALFRAVGIIVLIKLGAGLTTVMIWQVVTTVAAALAGQAVVGRFKADFRLQVGRLDWKLVRAHLPFGLASQLTSMMEVMIWEMVPLVVGLILGPRWIAPYYIAQKFPIAAAPIIWAAAEALFPAVSQHRKDKGIAFTQEILEVGTRWITIVALPLCLELWIVAPSLLEAWVGSTQPGLALILRLITAAVFMEGIAAGSIQVLWGRGEMRPLLIVPSCVLVTSFGLTLALLPRIGIVGAAWGLLLPMSIAAGAYLLIAARLCQVRVRNLLKSAFDGLLFPALLCMAFSLIINAFSAPGWPGVAATALGGGLGYLLGFSFGGAREEEMLLARQILAAPLALGRYLYGLLWRLLRRVGLVRSGYYLALAIKEALLDSPARGRAELNHEFEPRADPWDYASTPCQQDRIRTELAMLDAVRGKATFGRALEVGCAEGLFTQSLAERCESLLAVDISSVALVRARQRCRQDARVHFAEWDLRIDPLPDTYDLIVIIHALEYIRNPLYIRRARAKLVAGLRPGGHLLVGTMKVAEVLENAWWGQYFLRSGKRINTFFAQHPALKMVVTKEFHLGKDDISYDALFQKQM